MIKVDTKYYNSPFFAILSEDQLYRIHSASLEILERTGMDVHNKEALEILGDAGAYIEGKRIKIKPAMVEKALASAPSKIVITGRNGNGKVLLERNVVNYGLGTDVPKQIDPYTHEVRLTVLKDIENIGKVVRTCDNVDFNSYAGLASDVEPELQDLYHFKACNTYCDKPYFTTAANGANMKALIDISAMFAGGYEKLRSTPSLIVYQEPVSPLVLGKESAEVLLTCSEYGIPIVFPPMVQMCATGPATLAGALAQGSAETLFCLVLHQLKNPGSPFIWGPYVSQMDMKTTISTYGGPVLMKSQAALGQLSRFYNIPTFGFACCTDSSDIDVQCGVEMFWSAFVNALSGLNLCHDIGYMNSGLIFSLESILLSDEIIGAVKFFMEGIEVNDDTLALDLIDRVGPSGNYLAEEHTLQYFKREGWYPKYMNKKTYEVWVRENKRSVKEKLEVRVHEILEEEAPSLISKEEKKEIDAIIKERQKAVLEAV
ncbi:MAG: trimethylamine methyltransferase family protein [Spirochaetes bacterium]|nr:trimethylamine methyltransferase family protein [Spirochaetota bacterium]